MRKIAENKFVKVTGVKISVVIPAYNVEKYISRTINSLMLQTDKNFEVIIVDDGSTDHTLRLVEETIQSNGLSNYRLIHQENGGVSCARNKGLFESSADYVLFLDGDDYVSSDLIEKVRSELERESADILCWKFDQVDIDGKVTQQFSQIYDYDHGMDNGINVLNAIFDKKMRIWTGSALYKKTF